MNQEKEAKLMSFAIDRELKKQLEEISNFYHTSLSAVVRMLIIEKHMQLPLGKKNKENNDGE